MISPAYILVSIFSAFIQVKFVAGSNIVEGNPFCNTTDTSCIYMSGAITYGIQSEVHDKKVICVQTDVLENGIGTCQFPYPSQTEVKCTNGLKCVIFVDFDTANSSYSMSCPDPPNQIYWTSQFYQEAQFTYTNVSGDGLVIEC